MEKVGQPAQIAESAAAGPQDVGSLPNQPARIAINPRDFVADLQTGFARLQQQIARANVLGALDEIDRDRLEQWRRDDREMFDEERAE